MKKILEKIKHLHSINFLRIWLTIIIDVLIVILVCSIGLFIKMPIFLIAFVCTIVGSLATFFVAAIDTTIEDF